MRHLSAIRGFRGDEIEVPRHHDSNGNSFGKDPSGG